MTTDAGASVFVTELWYNPPLGALSFGVSTSDLVQGPTPTSAITPPQFLARGYRAGDWRHYQIDPDSYHTTASVGKIGPICFVRMADRQETDMVIGPHGLDHYCLSLLQRGAGARQPSPVGSAGDLASL
jgi:hypothetical protein